MVPVVGRILGWLHLALAAGSLVQLFTEARPSDWTTSSLLQPIAILMVIATIWAFAELVEVAPVGFLYASGFLLTLVGISFCMFGTSFAEPVVRWGLISGSFILWVGGALLLTRPDLVLGGLDR